MRRKIRTLEDLMRGQETKLMSNVDISKNIKSQNDEIINLLKSATCNLLKDSVDIYRYFPAKSNEDINLFLLDDGNFEKRRRAFENHLVCVAETDPNKWRTFNDTLINVLFSKDMIFSKKWPPGE